MKNCPSLCLQVVQGARSGVGDSRPLHHRDHFAWGRQQAWLLFHLALLLTEGGTRSTVLLGGTGLGGKPWLYTSSFVIVSISFFLLALVLFTFVKLYKWPGGTGGEFLSSGD